MGIQTDMGRVTCDVKVENAIDLALCREGKISAAEVRSYVFKDALVDTGASTMAMPISVIHQLGFTTPISKRRARNTTGVYEVGYYGPVHITILDRDITLDVMEVSDECPALVGQIPLEHLQLVVDMSNHRLVPSTANGGQWILDAF